MEETENIPGDRRTQKKKERTEQTDTYNETTQQTTSYRGNPWTTVSRKRAIAGTGASENKGLRGAERLAWLYIGKLHSSTTEEELADYLEEKGISGNKTV